MQDVIRSRTVGRSIVTALAATGAMASSAYGQEAVAPPEDPLAPYRTERGLVSLTKAVPELTPVSDYRGELGTRATLLGDPFDWRTRLCDLGITLDAQVTQVYQGVASGGSAAGNGDWLSNGLFEANLTFDTAQGGLWSGGLLVLTEQSSFGQRLKREPGSLSPVNATALWPEPYEDSSELMEYHLIQALPLDTVAIVGRLDPTNYLDLNSFACSSDNQFLNVSMNSNPLFGSFLTYSTYAALFSTQVTDDLTLAYGAWTPDTEPGDYGGDWSDYGAAFYPQLKYRALGHPGMIQAILAYTNKDSVDVGNPRLLQDLAAGVLPTETDNWIVELSGEQYLWEPAGASVPRSEGGRREDFDVPTKDFAAERPGLGAFYRASFKPEDRNAFNMYLSGGIGGRGVVPGRPHDRFGIGSYWLRESGDLDAQPGNVLGDEVGVEAFYNLAITPHVQFTLDAQWIHPGIESSDDAVVLGIRLNIRF